MITMTAGRSVRWLMPLVVSAAVACLLAGCPMAVAPSLTGPTTGYRPDIPPDPCDTEPPIVVGNAMGQVWITLDSAKDDPCEDEDVLIERIWSPERKEWVELRKSSTISSSFGVLAYDGKMLVFTASAESVGEMTFDLLVSVSGSEQQGATLHIWIPVVITSPEDEDLVGCDCSDTCAIDVSGSLSTPLDEGERLYLVASSVSEGRCYIYDGTEAALSSRMRWSLQMPLYGKGADIKSGVDWEIVALLTAQTLATGSCEVEAVDQMLDAAEAASPVHTFTTICSWLPS